MPTPRPDNHGEPPGLEASSSDPAPSSARLLVWCEVCGRQELVTADQAFEDGWDFAGPGGSYPAGVVTPRRCGECSLDKTVWWRLVVDHVPPGELTDRDRQVVARILRETKAQEQESAADASSRPAGDVDAGEAAELLGLGTSTLQHLVASGELYAVSRVGELLLLRRGDVIAYRNFLHERRTDFTVESSAAYQAVHQDEAARLADEVRRTHGTQEP